MVKLNLSSEKEASCQQKSKRLACLVVVHYTFVHGCLFIDFKQKKKPRKRDRAFSFPTTTKRDSKRDSKRYLLNASPI